MIRDRASRPYGLALALFIALVTDAIPVRAASSAIDLQTQILLRALAYDRNLKARCKGTVSVLVVHGAKGNAQDQSDIMQALSKLVKVTIQGMPLASFEHQLTTVENLNADIEAKHANVLYLAGGLDDNLAAITASSRAAHVVTVTVENAYLPSGVTLGVRMQGHAPKLWVNMASSKLEGMDFPPELLRIAEPVQ